MLAYEDGADTVTASIGGCSGWSEGILLHLSLSTKVTMVRAVGCGHRRSWLPVYPILSLLGTTVALACLMQRSPLGQCHRDGRLQPEEYR